MKKSKALVLLSGGFDSVTALHWALRKFGYVEALFINYGQRNIIEYEYAKKACEKTGVVLNYRKIHLPTEQLTALTNQDGNLNAKSEVLDDMPASYVPMRNIYFLLDAFSICILKGIKNIVISTSEVTPPCEPDSMRSTHKKIQRAFNAGGRARIRIHTPFAKKSKAETFQLADELGILDYVRENTMTCFNGDMTLHKWGRGCGDCYACVGRKQGYEEFSHMKTNTAITPLQDNQ